MLIMSVPRMEREVAVEPFPGQGQVPRFLMAQALMVLEERLVD
jgi:hypothetical protein